MYHPSPFSFIYFPEAAVSFCDTYIYQKNFVLDKFFIAFFVKLL